MLVCAKQVTTLRNHSSAELALRSDQGEHSVQTGSLADASQNFSRGERPGVEPGRPVRRIIVATDFSESSARAIKQAVVLAHQTNAALTILHVIDINPPAASIHCGPADDLMRQLWVTGAAELARLKKSLEQTHVTVQVLLLEGLPCETIVESSSGFDVLVINKPDIKSPWNFFSKHTARRVAERAQCAVHVVS